MAEKDKMLTHTSDEVTDTMFKRFKKIFKHNEPSERITHNAYVQMLSPKKFTDAEIKEMSGFFERSKETGDVGGMPKPKKKAQKKMSGGKVYARGSRKANYNG
jgi:hypothetical protein